MNPQFRSRLRCVWQVLLNVGFSLFCLRFLIATGRDADGIFAMFCAVGFGLGLWRPALSPFALVLSIPLLSGLQLTVLHLPYSALMVIASTLWLGWAAGRLVPAPPTTSQQVKTAGASTPQSDRMMLVVDILATITLMSLGGQIWQQSAAPDFWARFWQQSFHGHTDPDYYLTSGFLWLHGLFFFRTIREAGSVTPSSIKLVFLVYGTIQLSFFGVQWLFDFPARWKPGFDSPFEDIAAFGIMAVCCLAVCLSLMRRHPTRWFIVQCSAALLLAIAVGASWSRGTWLACFTLLSALLFLRMPRTVALLQFAALFGAIVFLSLNAGMISSSNNLFLGRLYTLVRFENIQAKEPERSDLYLKGWRMIQAHPWTGHGVGTFPLRQIQYARAGDPYAHLQRLPHNILLQLAIEQGVPAASLFIGMVGCILWGGIRYWLAYRRQINVGSKESEPARSAAHWALALTLVLATYLQANMTWDILLAHPTQPFFFWYVMAGLASITDQGIEWKAPLS